LHRKRKKKKKKKRRRSNSVKRFEFLPELIYLLMRHMYFFSDVQRW
jgi:hypothetical protein